MMHLPYHPSPAQCRMMRRLGRRDDEDIEEENNECEEEDDNK